MSVQRSGRHILINGMVLILVGLLWGLVVPDTPYPRLAMAAHISFVNSGLLFMVLAASLLALPHRVGPKSAAVMVLAVWLAWPMALSEVANSWWGASRMMTIAASQAGATGGLPWQELVVEVTHIAAGLTLIVAWALLIVGFMRKADAQVSSA